MHRPGLICEGLVHLVTTQYGWVLALLLIAGSVLVIPAGAAVTISPSGGDDTVAITNAITSAGATDGIVILDPGTYLARSIIVGNTVTIRANATLSGTAANTIIDAQLLGRVFDNTGGHALTIDSLTLRNGYIIGNGGAISADGGTLTIASSVFTNCSVNSTTAATKGGAIYTNGGTLTITSSAFSDCSVDSTMDAANGGAISATGSTVHIDSVTFSGCSAGAGGGGAIYTDGGTLAITSSLFTNCTAGSWVGTANAGAIMIVNGCTATIDSTTITGCSAEFMGGAIVVSQSSTLTLDSSTISGCSGGYGGAIMAWQSSTLTLGSSTITDCSAEYGGAIAATQSSTITLDSSTIADCSATNDGGAIYSHGDTVTITSSAFSGCSATHDGGAIYSHSDTVTITSSAFSGCSATNWGGAISSSSHLTVTSSTFTGNAAAGGAGSAIYSTGSGSNVHFSRFYQNLHPVWDVVLSPTSIEAQNNWWGTNDTPPTGGYVNDAPRLVLGATASPASITTAGTSLITANLTFNFPAGADTSLSGHVPDGIPVAFSLSGVSGTLGPLEGNVSTGSNATLFTPTSGGIAHIMVTVDGETVTIDIPVAGVVPAISSITPSSGVNTSPVSITDLHGSGFWTAGTTTVNLTRAGHANITTTTTALSTTQIACTLPITGAGAGAWDVVVINPDGQEATLPGGFTVTAPGPVPTAPISTLDTSGNTDDFPSSTFPPMTVTVNIGGDSKAWQAVVTGTGLRDLIVTGTVQPGSGSNLTAPPGIVYQYISLVPARFTSITKAVIHFTVPQSWLDENHIDPKSIVLYRQTANGWEALPTMYLYEKDGTAYFSGQSTGFSQFAIAGTPAAAAQVVTGTPPLFMNEVVQTPAPAAVVKAPVTTQTTAPPAPAQPEPAAPASLPVVPALLGLCCAGLIGGGWYARRWWIHRQNPALFEEYD
ncbi:MAG: PGF-pre-PGF domain-containing protein [Methanoregula sp.]|jgi:predicted outer membrane repeat protein